MKIGYGMLALLLASGVAQAQICRKGVAEHPFQQRGAQIVIDQRTGLQWQRCPIGQSGAQCEKGEAQRLNAHQAHDQVFVINRHGLAGFKDWRLPTREELQTLLSPRCVDPAIDLRAFPHTPPLWFWSASGEGDQYAAWYVDFKTGFVDQDDRNLPNAVRLVRGKLKPAARRTRGDAR